MQGSFFQRPLPRVWPLALGALVIYAAYALRGTLLPLGTIMLGGIVLAFLLEPLYDFCLRRLSPGLSALAALVTGLSCLAAVLWLLVPALIRQVASLTAALPGTIQTLRDIVRRFLDLLHAHGLDWLAQGEPDFSVLIERLGQLSERSFGVVQSLASGVSRVSLMSVLCYFLLADRENVLLRAELLIPLRWRNLVVRAACAVKRDLRLYLKAQALISFAVGMLSTLVLTLVGVPSPLLLGLLVGLFNVIPYLGPLLGSVPAMLFALGRGPLAVFWTGIGLFLVQQVDGTLLSPRIMGALTGISPAIILITVFAGAQLAGMGGMLFALPVLIAIRAFTRVYVQWRTMV